MELFVCSRVCGWKLPITLPFRRTVLGEVPDWPWFLKDL